MYSEHGLFVVGWSDIHSVVTPKMLQKTTHAQENASTFTKSVKSISWCLSKHHLKKNYCYRAADCVNGTSLAFCLHAFFRRKHFYIVLVLLTGSAPLARDSVPYSILRKVILREGDKKKKSTERRRRRRAHAAQHLQKQSLNLIVF